MTTGPTWSFSIGVPPGTPSGSQPRRWGIWIAQPLKLDWANTTGALTYDVYLKLGSGAFNKVGSDLAVSEWLPNQSYAATSFSWYVVAKNAGGMTAGPTWSFTIRPEDPNDQISEATSLSSMAQTRVGVGTIDSPTAVDMWSFTVLAGQRISFDIDRPSGSSLDSYIRLFDSSGTPLSGGSNDDGAGPSEPQSFESYLERTFTTGGTYYIGVSGHGNNNYDPVGGGSDQNGSAGNYTLVVSPGLAGTAYRPDDNTDHLVDILRFGTTPLAINPSQRTWIVVHGRKSSRSDIAPLAQAMTNARPGDQVLTLDWKDAAREAGFGDTGGEDAIINVATWAAAALTNYGFATANLIFVGHSWGSYVSAETAERISGGVDTIVALDPAANAPQGSTRTLTTKSILVATHGCLGRSIHRLAVQRSRRRQPMSVLSYRMTISFFAQLAIRLANIAIPLTFLFTCCRIKMAA